MPTIALLPGDGIGVEVAAAAVEVLNAVADDNNVTFMTFGPIIRFGRGE
jgi:isocitrate/isopropylmalate dehydrogenase